LRNYIFTRGIQWFDEYFDDTHVSQGTVPLYAIGRNNVDLKIQVDLQNNLFLSSLPANWTIAPSYPFDPMSMYFLLDKDSFMVTLQAFAPQFVSDAVANQPPAYPMLVNPKTTPRKTGWTDPAGVKRSPPPSEARKKLDFAGAKTLIEALQGLLKLASDLTALKEIRKASIVLYAYNQVIKQVWSITQAIQYLIDNRITATV
jgi:hypothetical protein